MKDASDRPGHEAGLHHPSPGFDIARRKQTSGSVCSVRYSKKCSIQRSLELGCLVDPIQLRIEKIPSIRVFHEDSAIGADDIARRKRCSVGLEALGFRPPVIAEVLSYDARGKRSGVIGEKCHR